MAPKKTPPQAPKVNIAGVSNEKSQELLDKYVFDTMTTTERGFLKALFENFMEEDPFDGVDSFFGQVLRGTNEIDGQSVDYVATILNENTQTVIEKCKVRVFDLSDTNTIPCSFGRYASDVFLIDLYPDTEYERLPNDSTDINAGDFVKVRYRNAKEKTKPYIVHKYSSNTEGLATSIPVGMSEAECKERRSDKKRVFTKIRPAVDRKNIDAAVGIFKDLKAQGKYNLYKTEINKALLSFPSVPTALIKAVISVESKYNPDAYNPGSGATGLMQVIYEGNPALKYYWARTKDGSYLLDKEDKKIPYDLRKKFNKVFGLPEGDESVINLKDPARGIWCGVAILNENLNRFKNNKKRALAGYNWNPTGASRDNWEYSLPDETQKYCDYVLTIERLILGEGLVST